MKTDRLLAMCMIPKANLYKYEVNLEESKSMLLSASSTGPTMSIYSMNSFQTVKDDFRKLKKNK